MEGTMIRTDWIKWRLEQLFANLIKPSLAALLLWMTNPSHARHEAALRSANRMQASPEVVGLNPGEALIPMDRGLLPDTSYNNLFFCSMTINRWTRGRESFGILGCVFDLRAAHSPLK
jgi:hypothetical protein